MKNTTNDHDIKPLGTIIGGSPFPRLIFNHIPAHGKLLRIAPEPDTIEAIPENIPPGTVIRKSSSWSLVVGCKPDRILIPKGSIGEDVKLRDIGFDECADNGYEISRPCDFDANGFPSKWWKLVKKGEK